jgi:hypothetical protein
MQAKPINNATRMFGLWEILVINECFVFIFPSKWFDYTSRIGASFPGSPGTFSLDDGSKKIRITLTSTGFWL